MSDAIVVDESAGVTVALSAPRSIAVAAAGPGESVAAAQFRPFAVGARSASLAIALAARASIACALAAPTSTTVELALEEEPMSVEFIAQVGPKGDPGAQGASYAFPIAATSWTIPHGLGRYPSVTTIDSSGDEIEGSVAYPDRNTVVVTFSAAVSGTAYVV